MAYGHLNKCKECSKKDVYTYRTLNGERLRAYEVTRSKTAKRKLLQARIQIRDRKMNPEKAWARKRLERAIKGGQIVPGLCERVNERNCYGRVEGHHDDYAKPLAVRWFCVRHHKWFHRDIKKGTG
jgi:hypothetical protein